MPKKGKHFQLFLTNSHFEKFNYLSPVSQELSQLGSIFFMQCATRSKVARLFFLWINFLGASTKVFFSKFTHYFCVCWVLKERILSAQFLFVTFLVNYGQSLSWSKLYHKSTGLMFPNLPGAWGRGWCVARYSLTSTLFLTWYWFSVEVVVAHKRLLHHSKALNQLHTIHRFSLEHCRH